MAGVVGNKGSGYATVTETPNYIGDALQNVEQNAFKYRAEKRLKDAADAKQADDDWKDYKSADFNPTLSESNNLNDSVADFANKSKIAYDDAYNMWTQTRDIKYKKIMENLKQNFALAKQAPEALNKAVADMAEGIKNDKYSPASQELVKAKIKSLEEGNTVIYPDENGIMRLDVYEVDDEGNQRLISKGQDAVAYFKGLTGKTNYDFEADKTKFLANNKLDESVIQNGFTTITKSQVDERIKAQAAAKAAEIVNNEDKMLQAYYNKFGKTKENFTQADKDLIAEDIANNLVKAYGETYKKDIDQSGALASRKYRDEQNEKKTNIGTGTITRQEGVIQGTDYVIPKGTKNFAVTGAERKFGDGRVERLKEIRRKPNGVKVFVVEETYEGQSINEKVPTESAKQRIAASGGKLTKADLLPEDFISVTTTSKKPTIRVYDTENNADDAENFSIILTNPTNGDKFSGLEQIGRYIDAKAAALSSGNKMNTESYSQPTPKKKKIEGFD